jgi:hypothetical protein
MKISRLLVLCFSLVSGSALANPYRIVGRLSLEATGNTHVRIRFYTNYGNRTPPITLYGTSHSDWFTTGASYSEDTGSGVQDMAYNYMCDCHVPTGSDLTYTAEEASSYIGLSLTANITPAPNATTFCDDQCALADSRDGGVDTRPDSLISLDVNLSRDLLADRAQDTSVTSDVPATPENQPDAGLAVDTSGVVATGGSTVPSSATATGGSVAPGGSTALPTSVATATGGNAGTSKVTTTSESESKKSSGCSLASRGNHGALSLLLALGLVALSWRRRR